uniref:Uncharacterized protein n=1 Tax=Oryza sativa subsp. japonica TaxID=39947 RepID=Q69MQ4_ORYSJ|nr:hypothetical protein [Oryza sativa Japonica Group]
MTVATSAKGERGRAAARRRRGRANSGSDRPVGHLASERARDAGVRPDFERRRREIGAGEREFDKGESERYRERERESERTRGRKERLRERDGPREKKRPTTTEGGKLDFFRGNRFGGIRDLEIEFGFRT